MRLRTGLLAAAAVLAGVAGAVSPVSAAAAPYCGITWGSQPRSGGELSSAPLIEVRTGQHECYDRVVFEFDGPADGYSVEYGEAYTEGEGLPMSPYAAGDAMLRVQLLAPSYDAVPMEPTVPYRVGDHAANVLRYRTLRDLMFGGSYEGYSTFAVGVRARLPFRVFVLEGPGSHSRIVIDVAHQWQA
jgi:hypothetical protein